MHVHLTVQYQNIAQLNVHISRYTIPKNPQITLMHLCTACFFT